MYLKYLFSKERKIKNNLKLLKHYTYKEYFAKGSMYHTKVTFKYNIPCIEPVRMSHYWLTYVYGNDAGLALYDNYPLLSKEEYLVFLTDLIKQYEYEAYKKQHSSK